METQKVEEKQGESPVMESKGEEVKEEVVVAAGPEEPIKEKKHEKPSDDGEEEVKDIEAEAEAESEEKAAPSESLTDTPSFKEESYSVGDLTEAEKKALEAFRQKVEDAIKNKSILKKSKKKVEEKAATIPAPVEAETPVSIETESPPVEGEAMNRDIPAPEEEPVDTQTTEEAPADASSPIAEKREILIEEPPAPPVEEGPKNFYIWGIPVHEGDDKTDALLLKFLRSRHFKVDDALSMLKSTVKWRKEFNTDSIEEEELEGKEDFEKWAYLYGVDKEGHPVCYNKNVFKNKEVCEKAQFSKFLRWRVQMMEQSIKSHLDFSPGGVHAFIQVIDLQNFPGLRKGTQAIKKFVSLLQDNYPELAAKQIVLNMPWWYYPAFYHVFKMEPKVVWAGPGKSTETLFKYIAPDQVPTEYGGLSRPNDTDFEGVQAPITQLMVKAGEKQSIELPIEEAGSTLIWDISIVGGDVVYGEEFVPNTYTVIIRKPKKLPSVTEPIRNYFKATESGKVVMTIDNSVSKKKKVVVYRSTIKRTALD